MTTTPFNDAVEINGSDPEATQLQIKGAIDQSAPLQTWENSAGDDLARVTADGRLQVGTMDLGTEDALIEANNDIVLPSPAPLQGFQSRGRITGAISNALAWIVQELELLGSSAISGLQTALRAKIIHNSTGDSSDAELRAADFEAINQESSTSSVGQLVGTHSQVTNEAGAYLNTAIGVDVVIEDENAPHQIQEAYGVRVQDVNQGTSKNFAIHTGEGPVHLGDYLEMDALSSPPTSNPSSGAELYVKSDNKLYMRNPEGEHEVGQSSTFLDLLDTPEAYEGQAGKIPVVTTAEDGLEFINRGSRDIDLPPTDPSVYDDEFEEELSSRWASFCTGEAQYYTATLETGKLRIRMDPTLTHTPHECGFYQPLPAGDWTALTLAQIVPDISENRTTYYEARMAISDVVPSASNPDRNRSEIKIDATDVAPPNYTPTPDFVGFIVRTEQQSTHSQIWPISTRGTRMLLRLRYCSATNTLYADTSTNGITWDTDNAILGFTPSYIYLAGYVESYPGATAYFDYFRLWQYFDAVDDPIHGQLVGSIVPISPSYLVLQPSIALTNERVLTPGTGMEGVDGGAGGQPYTLNLKIDGLTEDTAPDTTADFVATYDTSGAAHKKALIKNLLPPQPRDFLLRASFDQNNPYGDVADATNLYLLPTLWGNTFELWTGSQWATFASNNISASMSGLAANTIYDAFLFSDSGTPTIEFDAWTAPPSGTITTTAAGTPPTINTSATPPSNGQIVVITGNASYNGTWRVGDSGAGLFKLYNVNDGLPYAGGGSASGGTWQQADAIGGSRATTIDYQNGRPIKSGYPTHRWIATLKTTTAGHSMDYAGAILTATGQRLLWNVYNRVQRPIYSIRQADSNSYGTSAIRPYANNLNIRVGFVVGAVIDPIWVGGNNGAMSNTNQHRVMSALNSISTTTWDLQDFQLTGNIILTAGSKLPGLGFNYVQLLHYAQQGQSGSYQYGSVIGVVMA